MQQIYQKVTDTILAALQEGVVPWRKDWTGTDTGIPMNAVSGHRYRGVNVPLLWLAQQRHGSPTLRFLTYKQAREAGGQVRGGAKSTAIVFTKQLEVEDKDHPGEKKIIPLLRGFRVFNLAQCNGLPEKIIAPLAARKPINADARDPDIDSFVAASGVPVVENEGFNPSYFPVADHIKMPPFGRFESAHGYYAALTHELTHATGHKTRLDRGHSMLAKLYAFEELIAELGASFLCAEFGIDHTDGAASYIDGWMKLLKADARAFTKAASAAQAACDWLRGKALADAQAEAA
jgi:antirestriction protein ArdC